MRATCWVPSAISRSRLSRRRDRNGRAGQRHGRGPPLFSIRYGGMSAGVDATALLATIDPDQPLTGRFQITDAQGPTDCAAVVNDGVATPPLQRKIRPDRRRLRMGRNRLAHCNACSQRTCRRVPGRTPWY